jgi:hypothetical protein
VAVHCADGMVNGVVVVMPDTSTTASVGVEAAAREMGATPANISPTTRTPSPDRHARPSIARPGITVSYLELTRAKRNAQPDVGRDFAAGHGAPVEVLEILTLLTRTRAALPLHGAKTPFPS